MTELRRTRLMRVHITSINTSLGEESDKYDGHMDTRHSTHVIYEYLDTRYVRVLVS